MNLPEICWVCLVVLARFTLYPNIFDFAHKDVMRDCQPLSVWPDREFIRPISTVVNQGYVMLWNSTYLQILTLGYRSVEMVKVAWNWENVPAEAHRIRHLAKICESTEIMTFFGGGILQFWMKKIDKEYRWDGGGTEHHIICASRISFLTKSNMVKLKVCYVMFSHPHKSVGVASGNLTWSERNSSVGRSFVRNVYMIMPPKSFIRFSSYAWR